MAEKKKTGTKKSKTAEKQSKSKKQVDRKGKKSNEIIFDNPSEKFIHQLLPFIFIVFAILLEACMIFAVATGEQHVGMAGVFLKNLFLGLFGVCAFVIPIMLINLAINWRRFVDDHIVVSKTLFTVLFLMSLSGLIHIFIKLNINSDSSAFLMPPEIFTYSFNNIWSSGVIGGFFCECIYYLFKSVGTTILMIAFAIMFFIFSLRMTPRDMAIYLGAKMRQSQERKAERDKEKKALEKERKIEEEKQRKKEQARLEAKEREEEEKSAEADRRAEAREEKKQKDREKYGEMRFVEPEEDESIIDDIPLKKIDLGEGKPEPKKDEEDDDRIDVEAIFANPPEEFDPNRIDEAKEEPERIPVAKKKKEAPALEITEMTDIDTVPDDGEEGSVVPENIVREYVRPTVDLLKNYTNTENEKTAHEEIRANANALMETLKSFGVRIQEITYSRGPTITRYELKPDVGVRIRAIANLVDDIALSLATTGVRIEAPIPNKAAVGIEVPNKTPATVGFRSLIDTPEFTEKKSILTAALGKDVGGNIVYFDIGKMPHMLIAGTTGSGKSVCINCIIMSILYKASPRDVKLILIDPKKVEFQPYRSIPHLYAPIVTDPKKAAGALASAVAEMERRFELIESVGAKNISGYNELTADDPSKEYLPYIVIIIDELADLMMTAADDVETAICRIAQKARAAGIHLIVGTQRPSVDVVTGLIKANIPSRIAFTVASQVDSKTILDTAGADKLIGRGDMLFAPIGSTKPMRVQGAFIDDREVERIVEFINDNNDGVSFNDAFIKRLEEEAARCGNPKGKGGGSAASFADDGEGGEEGVDPKFKAALDVAIEMGKISTSLLQRRLEIGYGRAAKIIDRMEALGYVSAPDGNKPRVVLVSKAEVMEKRLNDDEE